MKNKIRVLLANEPLVAREWLKSVIQRQIDMEIVGEVLDPIEILLKVSETHADVIVLTLPDSDRELGIASHLFAEYPQILILAISPTCEGAFLYQQSVFKEQLSSKSGEDVLTAIRKVQR